MTTAKENIMRAILDKTQMNPEYTFSIERLTKDSGHTREVVRKWINAFIRTGLVIKLPNTPFKGKLRELDSIGIEDFFVLYNKSIPKLYG